jgi:Leucine Rich repeat
VAHKCRRLRKLSLAHCKAVSDVGLLSLSQKCTMLQELNLYRTELPFKVRSGGCCRASRAVSAPQQITDVGMLSIGERCRGMTSLNISGCENVTDVGISWLCSGCPALTNVNLSRCNRLSDSAMQVRAPAALLRPRMRARLTQVCLIWGSAVRV